MGHVRLLRPQVWKEDAGVERVVQLDDLVESFRDGEEQPVVPRLAEPFQPDLEGGRPRCHPANVLPEGIAADRRRDREDQCEVRPEEMRGRIVGPPEGSDRLRGEPQQAVRHGEEVDPIQSSAIHEACDS